MCAFSEEDNGNLVLNDSHRTKSIKNCIIFVHSSTRVSDKLEGFILERTIPLLSKHEKKKRKEKRRKEKWNAKNKV